MLILSSWLIPQSPLSIQTPKKLLSMSEKADMEEKG